MQILHYCACLRLIDGGIPRAILELTSGLSTAGKSVKVFVTEGNDFPPPEVGVQAMQTGPFDYSQNRFSDQRLALLKQHIADADVLHLHSPWEPANIQLAKLAHDVATPYVVSIHGLVNGRVMRTNPIKKRLYLRFGGRKLLHRAAIVHCDSQESKKQCDRWIPKANYKIVPLVFNPSEHLAPPPTSDPDKYWPQRESKKPVVLFYAPLQSECGIELAIEAVAKIIQKRPVRFMIAGRSETTFEKNIVKLIHQLDMQNHTTFVGEISGDRKTALLRATDVFVEPANVESLNFTVYEAMACGVPIVISRNAPLARELEESEGALLIEENANAISIAIETLLNNPTLQATMGNAAKTWVASQFEDETRTNNYVRMYREIMNQ